MFKKVMTVEKDVYVRKTRPTNVVNPIIKYTHDSNNLYVNIETCIFYTHQKGHILISMNKYGDILNTSSTLNPNKIIVNISSKFVPNVRDLIATICEIKPKTLFMNDGRLFSAKIYKLLEKTDIKYLRQDRLLELIDNLVKPKPRVKKNKKCSSKVPTYKFIKTLDPTITYKEYSIIYL